VRLTFLATINRFADDPSCFLATPRTASVRFSSIGSTRRHRLFAGVVASSWRETLAHDNITKDSFHGYALIGFTGLEPATPTMQN
jgi:hypothetical protein